jgi:hypothetical protein
VVHVRHCYEELWLRGQPRWSGAAVAAEVAATDVLDQLFAGLE